MCFVTILSGSAREAAHRISRELGHGVEDFVLCGADMLHIKGTYDKAAIVVIERDAVPFSDQMRLARSMLPKRTIVARADSRCACISSTAIRGLISQGISPVFTVSFIATSHAVVSGDWTFASLMLDPAVCSPQPCTITFARVLTVVAVRSVLYCSVLFLGHLPAALMKPGQLLKRNRLFKFKEQRRWLILKLLPKQRLLPKPRAALTTRLRLTPRISPKQLQYCRI
jgi:hypothetical protein